MSTILEEYAKKYAEEVAEELVEELVKERVNELVKERVNELVKERAEEFAIYMIKDGKPTSEIAEVTYLTEEEINSLRD